MASKNKWNSVKGLSTLGMIVGMVIVSFAAYFMIRTLYVKGGGGLASVDPYIIDSINRGCKLRAEDFTQTGRELKEPIEGERGDGFPDNCDICLGGDNNVISNSYGIPDECYIDLSKDGKIPSYKQICKEKGGCYINNNIGQCCILKDKCGPECK